MTEELISPSERAKFEAIEEYRYEVRRRIEDRETKSSERSQFWKEKVFAPTAIVLITVGLSGYLIPKVLESADRTRRANQATAGDLQEVAKQTTEMQEAIEARTDAIDSYWADVSRTNAVVGEFALKRDLGEMSLDEFARQDTLIENDRKRISESLDRSATEYALQLRTFRTWLQSMRMRITFLYPETDARHAAEQALLQLDNDLPKADSWLKQLHDDYENEVYKSISAVKDNRQLFKKHQLSSDEYRTRVNAVLDVLRSPAQLQRPPFKVDEKTIAKILAVLKESRPLT